MNIDLMIVPGVSFSLSGARLGYGQGFYDYYLENTNIYKIGICFKEQICNNLVVDTTLIILATVISAWILKKVENILTKSVHNVRLKIKKN